MKLIAILFSSVLALCGQDAAERIRRVENGLEIPMGEGVEPLKFDVRRLMDIFKTPAISVAVIDHYKIAWSTAWGVTELGKTTPVTPKTLFQAGSISKAVAATGALVLVEQGKLSLDEDVNQKLVSWKVPDNEFTKDKKVTLRSLLSHGAGLTVHGFAGYSVGEPIPTLLQIFNGEKPANNEAIRVSFVPGSSYLYSGGGFTIVQQLMIDVSGKPFPKLMRETVLDKVGMSDSTFEQPLPPAIAARTASGTYSSGVATASVVPGKWHIYPEMAAAGLWTTPTDLAKFGVETALAKQGKSNRALSESMTREQLTVQGLPVAHRGLGFFLGTGALSNNLFGHDGADKGFQALLLVLADSGSGVAIMANSDLGTRAEGFVIGSIAREYGWEYTPWRDQASDLLLVVGAIRGIPAALQEYAYLKKADSPHYVLNDNTLSQYGTDLLAANQTGDAILVFKAGIEDNPKNWRAYDNLGKAYMKSNQKELAIDSYEKSLQRNAKNQNAMEMLKKLKEQE